VRKITDKDYTKRPDCKKILDERNEWALNRNEFEFKQDLESFEEHKNDNLFLYLMIISMLSRNV
jgi:hypothetical protein